VAKLVLSNLSDGYTESVGAALAALLEPGHQVHLIGDLGAGKSCFTRGLAYGLGITEAMWSGSPTFTLVNEYASELPLYHLDLYRLESSAELFALGVEEYSERGVVVIEWADKFSFSLPGPIWRVEMDHGRTVEERRIRISRKDLTQKASTWQTLQAKVKHEG